MKTLLILKRFVKLQVLIRNMRYSFSRNCIYTKPHTTWVNRKIKNYAEYIKDLYVWYKWTNIEEAHHHYNVEHRKYRKFLYCNTKKARRNIQADTMTQLLTLFLNPVTPQELFNIYILKLEMNRLKHTTKFICCPLLTLLRNVQEPFQLS